MLRYWRLWRQRLWLIFGLVLVTLFLSVLLTPLPSPSYTGTVQLAVGVEPEQRGGETFTYNDWYAVTAADALVEDLIELVKTASFRADVARLAHDPAAEGASFSAARVGNKTRRVMAVSVSAAGEAQAQSWTQAAGRALTENLDRYASRLGQRQARAEVVDPASVARQDGRRDWLLTQAIRVGLALVVGIGLLALWEYLDDSVRDATDLERSTGIAVLGELPGR